MLAFLRTIIRARHVLALFVSFLAVTAALSLSLLSSSAEETAASAAAVAIAEKIVNDHPETVVEAMEKASQATNNDELAKRAKSLMNRARRKLRQR